MRKIIVSEFITLNGVVEAPGGNETPHPHTGWHSKYGSSEGGKYKVDELSSVDTLLLGKTTYEAFAAYWPGQAGAGFADPINRMPKYVVSRSLQKVEAPRISSKMSWNYNGPHQLLSRMLLAIFVKLPFSHNVLFEFILIYS